MLYCAIHNKGRVIRHECRDKQEILNCLRVMNKCGMIGKDVKWAAKDTPEELEAVIAAGKWERGINAGMRCGNV